MLLAVLSGKYGGKYCESIWGNKKWLGIAIESEGF